MRRLNEFNYKNKSNYIIWMFLNCDFKLIFIYNWNYFFYKEEAIIARQKAEIAELRAALEFLLKNQLSSNTINLDQLLAKGFWPLNVLNI